MANVFKLNLPGLNELMKSPEMQSHLARAGEAVANAAGSDYDHKTYKLNFVAVNNTLLKALGSVGLSMK